MSGRAENAGDFSPDATKVTVGDTTVTLKKKGQSTLVMSNILGRLTDEANNLETIWLDALVHADKEEFAGWHASGAISTILRRTVPTAHEAALTA
jgi:hypothetical protein